MTETSAPASSGRGLRLWMVAAVYAVFFLTGASALMLETLWVRRFVTVFGNSSYAVGVVFAAFMGGMGLGALLFGRAADRRKDHLFTFALLEAGVVVWALLMPAIVALLIRVVPSVFQSVESLAALTVIRFVLSFVALVIPSLLMGATLPVLSRFLVDKADTVGRRVSLLYGLNTLGAGTGCFVAGFFLLETIGMSGTRNVAVAMNLFVISAVLVLRASHRAASESPAEAVPDGPAPAELIPAGPVTSSDRLVLFVAFVSGFSVMSLEVLWMRYLVFVVANTQYSFTSILGVLLAGLATGSILYRLLLARRKRQLAWLGVVEIAGGLAVLASLLFGAEVAVTGRHASFLARIVPQEGFLYPKVFSVWLVISTIFVPTAVMGMVFPAVCACYTKSVDRVGRSLGRVYAVNTLGSITGSVAPMLFMISVFGIQGGIFAVAVLMGCVGVVLLFASAGRVRILAAPVAAVAVAVLFVLFAKTAPPNLNLKAFFADDFHRGEHNEVRLYKEGRTATVMMLENMASDLKEVYIGGVLEVPTAYMGHIFFKFLGTVGPVLYDDPDEVLILCMGGGIAAGTLAQHPPVERIVCVDLVRDMLFAVEALSVENNGILNDPKFEFVHNDARNYLLMDEKKFPLILCDSTHPRSPDSWVLYTQEFYQSVRERLASDGVFVQWVPVDGLTVDEYAIILNTFQSVFPHESVWVVGGYEETGKGWATTALVATPEKLSIDVAKMKDVLSEPAVKRDLEYWDFDTPLGFLETFLCTEDRIREWGEGRPVNTDDLPYTQYTTKKYNEGRELVWSTFNELSESVWPYLTNTGTGEESSALRAGLDVHTKGRAALFDRRTEEAFAIAPDCGKLSKIRENLETSREYLWRLAPYYKGNAAELARFAAELKFLQDVQGHTGPGDRARVTAIYEMVLEADENNLQALVWVGRALAADGDLEGAAVYLAKALELSPRDGALCGELAQVFLRQGKDVQAAKALKMMLGKAGTLSNANLLAWILATSNDELARDGGEAVRLAETVARATENSDPRVLDTLAAAYAEAGDFEEAVATARRAAELAGEKKAEGLAGEIRARLELYEAGKPYRMP